jgi:polar amino acid transport system ATP-binding protein/sulfate transport system ATP-binding protein
MPCQYGQDLLQIKNVSLKFGDKLILNDISVNIRDIIRPQRVTGQIVSLLGPSGIGKTQLFRIMAGLNQPTSGEVRIVGSDHPVRAGEVGVVAQHYPLLNHRTVLGNLLLAAGKKLKNPKNAMELVLYYLERFGLLDKKDLYPAQLSGGQKQRISIIQQVLCAGHILLLDEPFSGLDLLMLEKTQRLLEELAHMHDFNTTVIVTHDVTAAAAISDHIWMMGRDRDEQGNFVQGARIKKEYCLVDADLCWQENIITTKRFTDFVAGVKEDFRYM